MSSRSHSSASQRGRVERRTLKLPERTARPSPTRGWSQEVPDLTKTGTSAGLVERMGDMLVRQNSLGPKELEEIRKDVEEHQHEDANSNLQNNMQQEQSVKEKEGGGGHHHSTTPKLRRADTGDSQKSVKFHPVIHDGEQAGVIKRASNRPSLLYSKEHRAAEAGEPLDPDKD